MSNVFYYAPMSSATPVAWALTELEVPHEKVVFKLDAGDQRKPEFLKLNPNGKVPTLVVDGTPMFEAVAIMQWLGDRYGVERKVWPALNDPQRLQAVSWSTWAYVSFGGALGRLLLASNDKLGHKPQLEHCQKEINELLDVLDGQVKTKQYLLSNQFSIADLIVASVIGWATHNNVSLERHPNARAWLERAQSRPSFQASWNS